MFHVEHFASLSPAPLWKGFLFLLGDDILQAESQDKEVAHEYPHWYPLARARVLLLSSLACYWLTIFPGALIYVNRTVGENGTIEVSTDPVRSVLFQLALVFAVLLAGGLWAFRSMTRREIAASAALLILPMLAIVLTQLFLPAFPLEVSLFLSRFYSWTGNLASLLMQLSLPLPAATILAQFAPLLFIPFGRRTA